MSKADNNAEKVAEHLALFEIVDGKKVPKAFEAACKRPMKEQVHLIKTMEMRSDDVMIVAFMKSGTHWIWEVTSMLLSGKAEHEKRTKEFAMMEATQIEQLESQPPPRVLNSHLPLRLLPFEMKEKKVKVIHVYRNVKDVLVSAFFHMTQKSMYKVKTIEDVESTMINTNLPGGNYFSYLKEMDEFRKNNLDMPFFNMSYEDTKEDLEQMVVKLAKFLGVDASPQLCRDIAEATNFKEMKEADKAKEHIPDFPPLEVYRKGEVGDWKNYLTVTQSERLDAAMTQLESCDYHFRYEL